MKRLLWMTTIFLALMSCRVFADTIIQLFPNCCGDNFSALQRNGADFILIGGGTPPGFYDDFPVGYLPGSYVGGGTDLFIDSGIEQIGGQRYDLQATQTPGTLHMTVFRLPTNGQSFFQVPVSIDFSVDMINLETGDPVTVSGFASGHVAFGLSEVTGLYYAQPFATTEPGTLGLIGTGLLSVLNLARGRLRSR
jgi:hypothetical protein